MPKFFKTIGGRITLVVVALIVFAGVIGGVALWAVNSYQRDANDLFVRATQTILAHEANLKIYRMVRAEKDFALTGLEKYKNEHSQLRAEIDKDVEAALETSRTDEQTRLLNTLKEKVAAYYAGFAEIEAAYRAGDIERARELTQTSSNVLAADMDEAIRSVVEGNISEINTANDSAVNSSKTAQMAEIIVLIVAILAGIILSVWIIRSTNKALQERINKVIAAANTLLQYTKDLTGQQDKLTTIVNQVATGSGEQSRQVEENSKTMADLQKSLTDTAEASKSTAETTASAAELASKGTEAGKTAAEKLGIIDEIVKKATEVVKEVDAKAEDVTGIVVTTRDVADQINLLALNAAIEAARAGEAGRGFAVVADETRKLAEQATQTVDKIDSVVKTMKESAGGAVRNLGEGADQVTESTKIVQNALAILDQITAGAQEITSKTQDISAANTQQTQFAQKLVSALEAVATAAEQNTGASQEATASVKTVAEYIKKTATQSDNLTKLSKELQDLVGVAKGAKEAIEETVPTEAEPETPTPEEITKVEEAGAKLAKEREDMKKMAEELAKSREALAKGEKELEEERKKVEEERKKKIEIKPEPKEEPKEEEKKPEPSFAKATEDKEKFEEKKEENKA